MTNLSERNSTHHDLSVLKPREEELFWGMMRRVPFKPWWSRRGVAPRVQEAFRRFYYVACPLL